MACSCVGASSQKKSNFLMAVREAVGLSGRKGRRIFEGDRRRERAEWMDYSSDGLACKCWMRNP